MGTGRSAFAVGAVALLIVVGHPIAAQQGTLVGTVSDEVTNDPIPLVEILILGGGEAPSGRRCSSTTTWGSRSRAST